MSIRKIGVVGSLAAGAAFALAPLAAAEAPDFSDILLNEVQSMNWLFGSQATLAGVEEGVITPGAPTEEDPLSFSTISAEDLQAHEAFAALLFGVNWETEMSSDPGSYSLFNGAVTQFVDASNVMLYAMLTGGEQIDPDSYGDYLFGNEASILESLDGSTAWEDAANFFNAGVADLFGYFGFGALDM